MRIIFSKIVVGGQRLAGEGVKKRLAEKLGVSGVAQIVHLASGAFIGKDLQHLQRHGNGHFFRLVGLFTVFDVWVDILAVPLHAHTTSLSITIRRSFRKHLWR